MFDTRASVCLGATLLMLAAGCGSVHETLPPRSAMEQLLISTAADRAIETLPLPTGWMRDKAIFVETANLEAYDKPYVVQKVRDFVIKHGGRLAEEAESADIVLEVASGGLSMNKHDYLLGIPELPLPIPSVETLKLPELRIFKAAFYQGKAKLLFTALDPKTHSRHTELPRCYGKSLNTFWWVLFFGPFESSDLPEGLK